jgi:cellulose biosynthesis protein BcsQ
MRVVAVISVKGGVGKTTSAVNLAYLAARAEKRTLLLDLDPQGAASFLLRVGGADVESPADGKAHTTQIPHLDVLAAPPGWAVSGDGLDASLPDPFWLRATLDAVRDWYDEVVLDCPPGTSELTEGIIGVADALLVPVIPNPLSLRTLDVLADLLSGQDGPVPPMFPFFTLVDRRRKVHRSIIEHLQLTRSETMSAPVPYSADVEKMAVLRSPLARFAPKHPATQAYEAIWAELEVRMQGRPRGAGRGADAYARAEAFDSLRPQAAG